MESLTEIQICKAYFTKGIEVAYTMGIKDIDIVVVMMGIVFTYLKNILKMSDDDAIKFLSANYMTFPPDENLPAERVQ